MVAQTTTTLRKWWAPYRCSSRTDKTLNVPDFTMWGKPVGGVPIAAEPAFRALQMALEHSGYGPPLSAWVERLCSQGGIGGATCQKDGTGCSLHNYRVAIDIDPKQNPQALGDPFAGRLKPHHVAAVERITNVWGEQLWAWGGRWALPDRMHFQINVPPERTAVEWRTVGGFTVPNDHDHVLDFPLKPRDWADVPWAEYVAAGGSSVPDSRTYEATREDISWLWWKFIKPLTDKVEAAEVSLLDLRRRLAVVESVKPGVPGGVAVGDTLHVKIERRV